MAVPDDVRARGTGRLRSRTIGAKRGNRPKRLVAPREPRVDLEKKLAAHSRELNESLEQQKATSEILRIISRSPSDAQPVFDTIARSAARLCKAKFCQVFRFDSALIHFAAHHGLPPAAIEAIRHTYPIPPGRASATARSIASGAVE